jgi:hypothetical protein
VFAPCSGRILGFPLAETCLIDESAAGISGKEYWTEIGEKKHKLWAFILSGKADFPARLRGKKHNLL